MGKRVLSKEEKLLWQHYTKGVKQSSMQSELPDSFQNSKQFEIKVSKSKSFRKIPAAPVSNYESLDSKDSNWSKKLKQSKVGIEGKIDLHGMSCVEAHDKLYNYLESAQQKGKRVILVVTGKGGIKTELSDYRYQDFQNTRGVLKREVPFWLSGGAMRHMIVSFQEARQNHGGSGALYVVLKRSS